MCLNTQLLLEQYRQCHEHLRESDRKKDIVLGFYVTMSLALYGFSATIGTDDTKLFFGAIGLTVLGILLGSLLTLYRGWHGVYVIQVIALQEMIHKNKSHIDGDFLRNIAFGFNHFLSIELFVFLLLHTVVFLNSAAAFRLASSMAANRCWRIVVIGLIVLVIAEFLTHFVAMGILDWRKRKGTLGTKYLWVLQSTTENWP